MKLTSTIDQAIAAAKAQATAITQTAGVPATPARKLTMNDLDAGSIDVAGWLQVDEYGLHLLKTKDIFEELIVEIDLDEVVPCKTVRFGKNPAQYRKTYDGVMTFGSSKPWEVTLREAQSIDPTCKGEYASVEIPMVLTSDAALPKGGKTVEAGSRIGYAPSITGFKNFKKFWDLCQEKGLTGEVVKVRLGYEVKKGGGNTWAVASFELIESVN